ncbi:MAG: hypothetical protein Q8O55_08950 [Dehalococcoidales bacterium]|nr:hypothetical protein [Dehalococcoidales bacterium]
MRETKITLGVLKLGEYGLLIKVASAPISAKDFSAGKGEKLLKSLERKAVESIRGAHG